MVVDNHLNGHSRSIPRSDECIHLKHDTEDRNENSEVRISWIL